MLSPLSLTKSSFKRQRSPYITEPFTNENYQHKTIYPYHFVDTSEIFYHTPDNKKNTTKSYFFSSTKMNPSRKKSLWVTHLTSPKKSQKSIKLYPQNSHAYRQTVLMKEIETNPTIQVQKKKMKERVFIANFISEPKKKKYVSEKEVELEISRKQMEEVGKKVRLMNTMCDFMYPHMLRVKEEKIKFEVNCIKNDKLKRKKTRINSNPDYISVSKLFKPKVYHNQIYCFTQK